MPNWIDLGPAEDFPPGAQVCTQAPAADGRKQPVVVFNIDGGYHCMANVCPHAGLPLGDGERRGLTITCPYHGYTYRITDGKDLDDPEFGEPAQTYPIRIENGTLQVDLG